MTDTPMKDPGVEEPLILERLSDLEDQEEYLEHYPDIRGRAVVNPIGDEVGIVDDLYVNPRDRQVEMAMITFSGAVGTGGKRVLVPVEEIRFHDGRVRILTSEERIKVAPEFVPGAPSYEPYYEYWENRPEAQPGPTYTAGRLKLEDEDEEERALTTGED